MLPQSLFLLSSDALELVENMENTAEDEKEKEDTEKEKLFEGGPSFFLAKGSQSLAANNLSGEWKLFPADIILPPPEQV